jgi:Spy/CpxP family protein refolding chaperone
MPATRLIGHALTAASVLAAISFAGPAFAADEAPGAAPPRPEARRPAEGDRPAARPDRPAGDRPPGDRPDGDRPDGDRPTGERPSGERSEPGAIVERMKAELLTMDLSADQKKQVEEIFTKAREELAAHRQQNEAKEPAERREGARAILQALREKIGAVLSDEQRQALRLRMDRAREGGREGARAGGEPGGMLAERLKHAMKGIDLDDEQTKKLDALLADSQRKMREINEQTRAQIRDLMRDTRGRISELLTPEQREKFKEAMPEGGPARRNPEGPGEGERPRRAEPPAERL